VAEKRSRRAEQRRQPDAGAVGVAASPWLTPERAERTLPCLPLPSFAFIGISFPWSVFSLVRESQSRAPRKPCQHCEREAKPAKLLHRERGLV